MTEFVIYGKMSQLSKIDGIYANAINGQMGKNILTMTLNPDIIINAGRDADFLLLQQPQSRFEEFNRFSVSNRNVAFILENIMPTGIYIRTKAHKDKISRSLMGRKNPPLSTEHKLKISVAHSGKTLSKKHKKNISKTLRNSRGYPWKGGKYKTIDGYIFIYKPNHPSIRGKRNIYVFEHRLIMEKHLGRYLKPEERVHHINGIKNDNRIKNLIAFGNHFAHHKWHYIQEGMKKGEVVFDGRTVKGT